MDAPNIMESYLNIQIWTRLKSNHSSIAQPSKKTLFCAQGIKVDFYYTLFFKARLEECAQIK